MSTTLSLDSSSQSELANFIAHCVSVSSSNNNNVNIVKGNTLSLVNSSNGDKAEEISTILVRRRRRRRRFSS